MNAFRLILDPPAAGPWNMAVDEAILATVGRGEALPTLRLYAWQPACLSLGYSQGIKDVDLHRLRTSGWDLVRRLTGGRAILHADELTYAVIAPNHNAMVAGSLLESYLRIAQILLQTLKSLGLPVEINQHIIGRNSNSTGPVCFEVPSSYEITIHGKKLAGSAQARRKYGVLQHGSIPLYGDLGRITRVLAYGDENERANARDKLLLRATNLETESGLKMDWETVARAMVESFESGLDMKFETGKLSSKEEVLSLELMNHKYSKVEWTNRV